MIIEYLESGKRTDITKLVTEITWSGDTNQAARRLEIEMIAPSSDRNIPKVKIEMGKMLLLSDDNRKELFSGYIFSQSLTRSSSSINILAYDGLVYLLKSKAAYNFKKATAESIASKVAGDFGIEIGELAKTGIIQGLLIYDQSPFEIIQSAYLEAAKQNSKEYIIQMEKNKLVVKEKGSVTISSTLSSDTNITDATYSEDIEDMVNTVKIYNDQSELIDQIANEEWKKSYGLLQEVYQKEEGKDPYTVARNMLKGLGQTGTVNALGNTDCITGAAVKVKEPFTGLTGLFYISADTHTWQDGVYNMELGLDFKNLLET
jgi:hypothetical protein